MRRHLIILLTISLALLLVAIGFSYLSIEHISGALAQTETDAAQTTPLSTAEFYTLTHPTNEAVGWQLPAVQPAPHEVYTLVAAPDATNRQFHLPAEVDTCAEAVTPVAAPPADTQTQSTEPAAPLWMRLARWLPPSIPDNYIINVWVPTDTGGNYILVSGDQPQPIRQCHSLVDEKV
jgi:hypothetical protein